MGDWRGEREWYNDRIFEAFISKEEIDRQGELVRISGLEKVMDWFIKYGVIHYKHSFINFAEPIGWKREGDAIKIKVGAHSNYEGLFPHFDWIWKQIKGYYLAGVPGYMSIGGSKVDAQLKCDSFTGTCFNDISKLGVFEASWVGASPANTGAAVTHVNVMAKAEDGAEYQGTPEITASTSLTTTDTPEPILEKRVEKRGSQWCVIHCHGPDAGKPIKCFDTKEQAEAMHRAIEANKGMGIDIDHELFALAGLTSRPEHEKTKAPKDWWDRCVRYAQLNTD